MERDELPNLLYKNIDMVKPYPNLVKLVSKMIEATAFFPGGKGLWLEECAKVFSRILVLGQDFSTAKEYEKMLKNESTDLQCPTWRNLIKLFNEAGIDFKDCFFSNVFMGLRDTESATGEFPGIKDKNFVERSIKFLSYQINVIKPKLIITLGKLSSDLLAKLSEIDLECWKDGRALSVPNIGLQKNVRFKDTLCTCVVLEHTSLRHLNVKRRKYINNIDEYLGNCTEVEMLKDANIIINS